MRTNLAIAALIYPMVQAIIFGLTFIPLEIFRAPSQVYFPAIAATFFVAAPIALFLAPKLRSRAWKQEHGERLVPS
jgi:hypothetical protein